MPSTHQLEKVALVGSGNWGSAIAKICGQNVTQYPDTFDQEIKMWTFEEEINGRKLTEIINEDHENTKYLPGVKLPANVKAIPDLIEACRDATILVFVLPHQFVEKTCNQLHGKIRKDVKAISLIKGVDVKLGGLTLISDIIRDKLDGVDCSVLMGANLANEVAMEHFCETTIGYHSIENGKLMKKLFHTSWFHCKIVDDASSVELCGALKNVVGIAAGLVDGLKLGDNTKAAIIRIGLHEMRRFCQMFYKGKDETFFESCGVADLITTCYGGRNRKVAEAHVLTGKPFEQLETEMLNGQKLQGTSTAIDLHQFLITKNAADKYPLFQAVYEIVQENKPALRIIELEHITE